MNVRLRVFSRDWRTSALGRVLSEVKTGALVTNYRNDGQWISAYVRITKVQHKVFVRTAQGRRPTRMVTAITSTSAPSGSAVALHDKLARCTRQLGDWEACPSGKTPEGKKIIDNLRAQIGNIETKLAADSQRPQSLSTLGSLVDTFA